MPKWLGHAATSSESVPESEQWKEQWERVGRWYEKCTEIHKKSSMSELNLYDQDIMIVFFQNCYHLQDWIISSRKDLESNVKSFIESNFEMKACRNISDGFKHKRLTNKKHPDPDFNWYVILDFLQIEPGSNESGMKHYVAFSNGDEVIEYDLFKLINDCFTLWEKFIKVNLIGHS